MGRPLWALADDRYFWNFNMAAPYFFLNPEVDSSWVSPIIQGFVQSTEVKNEKPVLIS